MNSHVSISPQEAGDRLAIREPSRPMRYCADRRDAKGQMALFTPDTHFVVYMNAKDPKPSMELHSREALAPVFADLNKYRRDDAFRRTEHDLDAVERPGHRRGVLPGTPRHRRRRQATPDGRVAALQRHVREKRRRMAVLGAPVVRGLGRRTSAVMTVTENKKALVIVGATGIVGGHVLRYALDQGRAMRMQVRPSPILRGASTVTPP